MDRVYVANLPPGVRIIDLDDFFRPFGKILHIDVNNRANPECAYVQFDNARNAFNAVKYRNGYDYKGYTLQLRLVEKEVRNRRDATPPPPPPRMFVSNGVTNNNTTSNNRINGSFSNSSCPPILNSQWPNNNSLDMIHQNKSMPQCLPVNKLNMMSQLNMDYNSNNRQQNMYSASGRSNIPQQYSNTNMQQQYSNTNVQPQTISNYPNMQQQYSNSNRSNMHQQYSNSNTSNIQEHYSNRLNMSQQNVSYTDRSGISQQNMMSRSSSGRSNMQEHYSNRLNMSQQNVSYPDRSGISQQNMMSRSSSGQSNMQEHYSNRLNMSQQNVSYPDLSGILQPNMMSRSSSGQSNMQEHYSNRLNMSQQNVSYPDRSGISQQNMMSRSSSGQSNMQPQYPNTNGSYMSQQQQMDRMVDYSNNSFWKRGDDINLNRRNYDINNVARNEIYNANNDPYAMARLQDNYTRGLSGSGRKWFNRYIRQGFSPEMAREKALEHRTVPYLREDPKNKQILNYSTNSALETIGNTIMSLLSTNSNNIRGGNMETIDPSSSLLKQTPRNVASRRQYLRSLDILKSINRKRVYSAKDRITKKYHTQIVRDYEQFNGKHDKSNASAKRKDKLIFSASSNEKMEEKLRIKKGLLLKAAKILRSDKEGRKRLGGAYKKRVKLLIHKAGFSELEAKALALHPLEKLQSLIALKQEYDLATKKINFIPAKKKVLNEMPKIVVYRNDIKYLNMYRQHSVPKLSRRIITALNECIVRIHNYEKEQKLLLTGGRFVSSLQKAFLSQKKELENKKASNTKTNVSNDKMKANENT